MILYFPMMLLQLPATKQSSPTLPPSKKKEKKSERTHKGTKRRRAQQWWRPSQAQRTEESGHSNSERMLMRLLWSLRCFPCFQHLQGPHGARSIKTTKWEIWTFFCDAGASLLFNLAAHSAALPRGGGGRGGGGGGGGEKIRKTLRHGVGTGKLWEENIVYLQIPEEWSIYGCTRGLSSPFEARRAEKELETLKFEGWFSQPP